MPWFDKFAPENVKKNICIYLIQRHLGEYFEKQISRDQLEVDITNGSGVIENILLDVQAVNDVFEKYKLPLELVEGSIGKLHLEIPWRTLLKDSCYIRTERMKVILQPKQRSEYATSVIESMYNSMNSSVQLAEEFAKCEQNIDSSTQNYEGFEIFVEAIDSVLRKVKIDLVDTIIQIEHIPKNSSTGVGIIINIGLIQFSDEAGTDPNKEDIPPEMETVDKGFVSQAFTTKKLLLQNVSLSTVEFSSSSRIFIHSCMTESYMQNLDDSQDEIFYPLEDEVDANINKEATAGATSLPDTYKHVVRFGKLNGKHEVHICMKQPDNLEGPKVSFEVNLGGFSLFLTPRQIHLLTELVNGLINLDYEELSETLPKQKHREKPMTNSDYLKVEQVLQQQIQPPYGFSGMQQHGWSTSHNDDSDNEDTFLPMQNTAHSTMYDSTLSVASSSMESSVTSSIGTSATEHSSRYHRKMNNIDSDPTAEISHFQVRIVSLAIVLLHEDIMTVSADNVAMLIPSSVQQMQCVSESFFKNIGDYVFSAFNNKDFVEARTLFENACPKNHLRLLATPVQIEANETTTSSVFSITGQLTAAKLELLECLFPENKGSPEYIPLLVLGDLGSNETSSPYATRPMMKLTFKHIEKTTRHQSVHRLHGPKTDFQVFLNKCTMELDLTLLDRINALLNPQPVCVIENVRANPWNVSGSLPTVNLQAIENRLDIKVSAPCVNVRLRFPIPDFRPAHDMSKVAWWNRHVRPDYLLLSLHDFLFETKFMTNQACEDYEFQSRYIEVYYYETESSPALLIAKSGVDEKLGSLQDLNADTRLQIRVFPDKKSDLNDLQIPLIEIEKDQRDLKDSKDPMTQSIFEAILRQTKKQPGPFSAKKVVHESDTPHHDVKDDPDEIIMPGDKEEIDEFMRTTITSAKILLDIFLPTVSMQIISKHIYELLYNRINNDLLLWQPSAPKAKVPTYDNLNISALANLNVDAHETFAECNNGVRYGSESESDEEESDEGLIYYSTYDNRMKHSIKQQQMSVSQPVCQNYLVMNLQINQGVLNMFTLCRDGSTNVIPEHNGEFLLNVVGANVFIVSGYQGDDDLSFVCLQVTNAQLYHCDVMTTPSQNPPLRGIGSTVPNHLKCTLYKSEPGMLIDCKERGSNRELLTVAVRVQASHETHHVKTARVAIGLNKATLRHRMCAEPNSWISQILDFFNVQDYPISGYNAKEVLTEFHLHMWDCAIDYRPLHLPLRSAVTLGTFSMSSQFSAQSNTSTLRFIFEECDLFISEKGAPKNGKASNVPVNLKNDYVNVIELGIFELSIRTNDKKSGINPHLDLRASNNVLHIHTCADSGRALMQLITYYASDGDLNVSEDILACDSNFSSPRHQSEGDLISVDPQDASNISKSQREQIHDLIGEAMEEMISVEANSGVLHESEAKMFFFPDEKQAIHDTDKPLPQVTSELGDVKPKLNTSNDTDDEFTFIENEGGPGKFPNDGEIKIVWHTKEPIRYIANHFFQPTKRFDLLDSATVKFPTPVMRYTLCEMTIVWHMYGGNDFTTFGQVKKKTVNFSDGTYPNDSVSFQKSGGITFKKCIPQKSDTNWKVSGGVNRDQKVLMELQLNKVRIRHEVFPENEYYASRQVFLVNEVEIRDRLAVSNINKFLYLFTNQKMPKQSNAYMVQVRMIHIRPDVNLKSHQECGIKISLLPLRLNIDQDALLFLIDFFSTLAGSTPKEGKEPISASKHNTPTHQPPIMSINTDNEEKNKEIAKKMVDENLMLLLEESKVEESETLEGEETVTSNTESRPLYFRNVIFSPDVPIRVDYQAKRLDMTHGPITGILMGLAQLNCSEIRLRFLQDRRGFLGFDRLVSFLLQEWLNDIKKHQLPSLLGGVGPLHSFMQLFQGIRDLFWLPIEQYQKDGRIVRGLQRGANSFTTSTAVAALELTTRLIYLIQITAETAYDMLSPGPSVKKIVKGKGRKKKYNQPQDIREGVTNAYMLLKEGIGETANNIAFVASHQHEQKGYSGALGGLVRELPSTMIKPIIIASAATSNVLGGMRSQLVPDARTEANQKWRCDDT